MRQLRFVTLLLLFVLALVAVTAPHKAEAQANLLQNPGFEGNYTAWQIQYGTAQMAANWTPWWVENAGNSPIWAQPEYKPAERTFYPTRVYEGERAQQYFTFYKSHFGGFYQQVFGVTPGQTYRFTIWAQVWSSTEGVGDTSVNPANPRLHIGIDPTGAAWPGRVDGPPPSVEWSAEAPMGCLIDNWCSLYLEVTAQNDVITVYTRSSPDFATIHNDIYFDAAHLSAVGAPEPTATNTPGPATDTPVPTATSEVTATPTALPATNTPEPTPTEPATETPEPTETPTEMPTVAPTDTSVPPTATQESAATDTPTPVLVAEVELDSEATPVSETDDVADSAETPTSNETTDVSESDDPSTATLGLILAGAGVLLLVGVGGAILLRR